MPGFGEVKTKKETEAESNQPMQLVKTLKWHIPDFNIQYGKNLAIIGQPMVGKTLLAMLMGYFNSEYKDMIREAGYDKVIDVMDAGLLPEIEKIMVLESENNLLKSLNSGVEKLLLRPFIDNKIIQIAPILIPRKEAKLINGRIVSVRREMIEELKEQFDQTIKGIIADEGPNTLFIIDSMSAYKKLLDDKFGLLYEIISKRDSAVMDGIDTYKQAYYASRNTWWDNLLQSKRAFNGWNVDTYKEKEIPEYYRKPGEDDYRIQYIAGTSHYLDMEWRIEKLPNGSRMIHILNGRYSPENIEEHSFAYPLNSKMGAMPLIASMAEKLLIGEQ